MPTVQVTLSLPETILEKAQKRGLLDPEAVSDLVVDAVFNDVRPRKRYVKTEWPADVPKPDVPPGILDLISPELYGKGKELGDIIAPIDVEWEAMK
jgi:hypothetical protein